MACSRTSRLSSDAFRSGSSVPRIAAVLAATLNNVLKGKANTYGRVINEFDQRVVSVRSYCPNKRWIDVNRCPRWMILLETTQSRHLFRSLSAIRPSAATITWRRAWLIPPPPPPPPFPLLVSPPSPPSLPSPRTSTPPPPPLLSPLPLLPYLTLGLGNISGRLAMLAAIRRAGLIASELGPRQRLAAHGEKMLTYKAEQRLGTGKR